jgi:alkylation response protein AidB-like acyl-CoA dehydrogenase
MLKWTEPMPWWTPEQVRLAAEAAEFVTPLLPRNAEVTRTREFPWDVVREIGRRGWFGVLIPERFGGIRERFGGVTSLAILCEEFGRVPALTMNFMATAIGGAHQLVEHGSPAMQDRWLGPLARGEALGALAITEPFAGSDAAGVDTRARRERGGWVIGGKKRFISNIGPAAIHLVYARTGDAAAVAARRHLSVFLVAKGAPGFHIEKFNELSGFQYLRNGTLDFDDVWVPDEAVVGEIGQGWEILTRGLNVERILNAAFCVGGMRQSVDAMLDYTRRRLQFDRPLLDNQAIQFKVADAAARLHMTRVYLHYAAQALALGTTDGGFEASIAKLKAAEYNTAVALDAVQCLGGDGYTRDYPVEQILRDAKLWEIGGGSAESLRGLIFGQVRRSWEGERGRPPAAQVADTRGLEERLLEVLADEYRRHPALYTEESDLRARLDVSEDDLQKALGRLEERQWLRRWTGSRGLRLAKASYRGLQAAQPLQYYRRIPEWVSPDEVF